MTAPLLSIQKLSPDNLPFPAYFVASTAPINIEDNIEARQDDLTRDFECLNEISQHLQKHKGDAEILIVIHGYNTSKISVKNWFESIARHLANHFGKSRSPGLLLIGYRWPSEQIRPREDEQQEEGGSFQDKRQSAKLALPVLLGKVFRLGIVGLIVGSLGALASMVAIALPVPNAVIFLTIFSIITAISGTAISPVLTVIALRLVGYFRDNYRASNFGVSDLVELIRQIDNELIEASPGENRAAKESYWENDRIKLSFIGHSMGGFVVTNTVRILSDVFDPRSIGSIDMTKSEKEPPSSIGNVFSLGRLVLVSPDIPAETIISGRANFLQSSLRRFEEAYLFSNEGDMALRLASTAANYFSYPTKTQDGGYRLGNVTVRNSTEPQGAGKPAQKKILKEGAAMRSESYGMIVRLPDGQLVSLNEGQQISISGYPLDYLYIREQTPLSQRQKAVALAPNQKPIGELFTFFDCTDYTEKYVDLKGREKTIGLVSHALRKQALTFGDYVSLTIDYFSGKIDTHGGYFSDGESEPKKGLKPEATFTKLAIYGLACIGFEKFLLELPEEPVFNDYKVSFQKILENFQSPSSELTTERRKKVALSQILSSICRDRGIQVLLAQKRYTLDVLERVEQNAQNKL
jgi:pimeloyl-ACP methyl ester carboxylesterase